MRALVFDGQSLKLETRYRDPHPEPGEAVIRPLLAGICATDLEICRGYMGHKGVIGHEFVGVVEAVNDSSPAAQDLIGRRVVGTINCPCGRCERCEGGLGGHCAHRTVLGISGRDGCFADRFTLPVRNLLPVPDALDDDRAVFTEPLAAACQIPRQVRLDHAGFITVLGDGRLGLLVAQVLSRYAANVRVIGRHPRKLSLCERWGIKHRLLDETAPRNDQDLVVDCTGSAQGLKLAMQMVRPRGQIVLKTTVADQSGMDLSRLVVDEVQLIGSRCGPFPQAISMLLEDQVDVVSLISRRMRFEDGLRAMEASRDGDTIKVLLEFA